MMVGALRSGYENGLNDLKVVLEGVTLSFARDRSRRADVCTLIRFAVV